MKVMETKSFWLKSGHIYERVYVEVSRFQGRVNRIEIKGRNFESVTIVPRQIEKLVSILNEALIPRGEE